MTTEYIAVEGVPCPCPGTPHPDGDTVYLHPNLSFEGGAMAEAKAINALQSDGDLQERVQIALLETYVLYGVADWTLTNGDGAKIIPVNQATIREHLLSNYTASVPVAEKGAEVYKEQVLAPLRARLLKSLPPGRMNGSTSAKSGSSAVPRKRSKPSSTSTTGKAQPSA